MSDRMPAIFFGHGNPLNALASNAWTDGWAAVGKDMPRPRAVLCVSAHWYLPATLVTGSSVLICSTVAEHVRGDGPGI